MGRREKLAIAEAIRGRYRKASKEEKKLILNEFCQICGFHRKHAIRLLSRRPRQSVPERRGRTPKYRNPIFLEVLKKIWLATDQMCSRRLKEALPLWLPKYIEYHGPIPELVQALLLSVSASTIDRLIKPVRLKHPRGLGGTKPGSILKNQIPIRTNHWDVTKPGFVEADTVAHCGNSLEGDFAWSLTLTDIHTGWTACRAIWNRGAKGVLERIKEIEAILPFPLKGFDCDNGSEFLNHHLMRYFASKKAYVQFTRSRPYAQNDNPHVEQKNWSHVRQLFGYDRFERLELVPLMNDLYANEWSLYQNHFCPTFKLIRKTRIRSQYKKTYEIPRTPYSRVLECAIISDMTKEELRTLHDCLNPFELKATIERKLKAIFQYVTVTSNVRQRI